MHSIPSIFFSFFVHLDLQSGMHKCNEMVKCVNARAHWKELKAKPIIGVINLRWTTVNTFNLHVLIGPRICRIHHTWTIHVLQTNKKNIQFYVFFFSSFRHLYFSLLSLIYVKQSKTATTKRKSTRWFIHSIFFTFE